VTRVVRALVALAVASAGLVAAGVGLIYPPAGVITAGLLGLAGAYVGAYLLARTRTQTREVRRR
jgi:uncharacterized membrane protein YfcA